MSGVHPPSSPTGARCPDPAALDRAFAECSRRAADHYENFPVGSWLLPAPLRRHIHAVYAFARTADDFADETVDSLSIPQRLALLDRWEHALDACLAAPPTEPTFIALRAAIEQCDLPLHLFRDLIDAFKQDVTTSRYASYAQLLDYSRRSANPIGRLVLLICGYRDPHLHLLSDRICSALQLANFWQDISVDILKDRIYLPEPEMAEHGVSPEQLRERRFDANARRLIEFQVQRTRRLFEEGRALPRHLGRGLRTEIRLTWLGGMEILRKIQRLDFNTVQHRPTLSKWDFARLLVRALLGA